jgi:oligopeptide/dipeptide ABC transporter ATP-binding protein
MDLQESLSLTYMFVTHNLSVVKHISDDIMVMYLGQCVERAPSDELFTNPMHPYTKALLSAIPVPKLSMRNKEIETIKGEVTSPINPKPGCRFAARCQFVCDVCREKSPRLVDYGNSHFAACFMIESMRNGNKVI